MNSHCGCLSYKADLRWSALRWQRTKKAVTNTTTTATTMVPAELPGACHANHKAKVTPLHHNISNGLSAASLAF